MIKKPQFLKVEEDPNFVRDTATNAILANNLKEKKAFIDNQKREQNISKITNINERVEKLEKGVEDIKDMLKLLINNSRSS
jgi:hypothetical protein